MDFINTEPHKRMQYVDPNDFDLDYYLDAHTNSERHCLKDKNGYIIHIFSSKEQADQQIDILKHFAWEIRRGLEEKVRQHKKEFPKYYIPTYEEANFTHKALYKGFTADVPAFNPYENWFGVSVSIVQGMYPDAILSRNNKQIILSKYGICTRTPLETEEKYSEFKKLSKSGSIKYLCFKNNDQIEYETFSGELPSNEFIEQFIS